ncbi:MAG: hypothetical protein ACK5NF_04130 [Bacilli bacterium]
MKYLYNDLYGIPIKFSPDRSIYYNDRLHNILLSVQYLLVENDNKTKVDYTSLPLIYYTDEKAYNSSILKAEDNLLASKYLLNGFYSNKSKEAIQVKYNWETYDSYKNFKYNIIDAKNGKIILENLKSDGMYGIEVVLDEKICDQTAITIEGDSNAKTRCSIQYYNIIVILK